MRYIKGRFRFFYIIVHFTLILSFFSISALTPDTKLTSNTPFETHRIFHDVGILPDHSLQETHSPTHLDIQSKNPFVSGLFLLCCMFITLYLLHGIAYWHHIFRSIYDIGMFRKLIIYIHNADGEKSICY